MSYWVLRPNGRYMISQWNAHDCARTGDLRYAYRDGLNVYYTRVEARP